MKTLIAVLLLVLAPVAFAQQGMGPGPGTPHSSTVSNCGSYSACFLIAIPSGAATGSLTGFPLKIVGNASTATVGNGGFATNSSGFDVNFFPSTTGCNGTKLTWETDAYSASTSNSVWWVLASSISTTGTTLGQMCIGNSSVTTDQSNKTAVWASNYRFVAHLANGTTLSSADSTSFANNGTNNLATAGVGQIDGGAAISGSTGSMITTPYAEALTDFTASAWFKSLGAGSNSYDRILEKDYTAGFVIARTSNNANSWSTYFEDPSAASPLTITLTDGLWHLIKVKRSGTTLTITADGGAVSNTKTVATTALSTVALFIGFNSAANNIFNGVIDETRIENRASSTDYDNAEYSNQKSSSTFVTYTSQ
jgi:hypothetical protein